MREGIAASLRRREEGTAIPFATVDKPSGRVAGGTSFLQIDLGNRRLEIGSTWLGQPWREALNTEAKLLMLGQAFEAMGCVRVEFQETRRTNNREPPSCESGHEEGTLRNYRLGADGRPRRSSSTGIVDSEWAAVKAHLQELLDRPR